LTFSYVKGSDRSLSSGQGLRGVGQGPVST
jgi:hypothetical protein